ncbi:MAG: VCBS repeat-containing protein [Ferruginibacter sp.]
MFSHRFQRNFLTLITLSLTILLESLSGVFSQGIARDGSGQACVNNKSILACWNFEAGRSMPSNASQYAERFPFLNGWDFRINLPHTRFQLARENAMGATAMVGIDEHIDGELARPCSGDDGQTTFDLYGHVNNSIWLFNVQQPSRQVFYKVIPSRRNLQSNTPENITSLATAWVQVGSGQDIQFRSERPAVAVVGKGIGTTTIYIVARGMDNRLYFSSRALLSTNTSVWSGAWQALDAYSGTAPAIAGVVGGKVIIAWRKLNTGSLTAQLYHPTEGWKPAVEPPGWSTTSYGQFQLIWDGIAINMFGVSGGFLRHAFTRDLTGLDFAQPVRISNSPVGSNGAFHSIVFNNRFHLAFNPGGATFQRVFYITSKTSFGFTSSWSPIVYAGFSTNGRPVIGNLYENLFIAGRNLQGKIVYSRKDPNRYGAERGNNNESQWLDKGLPIDPLTGGVCNLPEFLNFNSDLYLVTNKGNFSQSVGGTYLINFGRAAMKKVLTEKWGMTLFHGKQQDVPKIATGGFAISGDKPSVGDFDGDGDDDFIKFDKPASNDALAPVYVAINDRESFPEKSRWHASFSAGNEIPMVGDFNGDGKDDIIRFTQKRQNNAAGAEIGPAVVWVSLSNGSGFEASRVWHTFFSLKGEIPMVGDFNGDGKDDIITFTQAKQLNAAGVVIGPAVVWVSLSNGNRFETSRVWHTFFSLKGEIPKVGDFNGDGKADIATFVQHSQNYSNGSLLGEAPVWISLSTGSRFGSSTVWHRNFCPQGQVPSIYDMNMDGKDDIVSFVHGTESGDHANDVYAAYSKGNECEATTLWQNKGITKDQIGMIASLRHDRLNTITGRMGDTAAFPAVIGFHSNGSVNCSQIMYQVPYPAGAPWERYKWFTEKGIGATQFPEWIYENVGHCTDVGHDFILSGAAGSGGATQMTSSVRFGGRAGHILQEFGHAIFANCFRETKDPFGLWNSMYYKPTSEGGFGANEAYTHCDDDTGPHYYDCRDLEHIFLGLLVKYRVSGDQYRERILTETDPVYKTQLRAAYTWLKTNWFNGMEFKTGPAVNAGLPQDGVPCLSGECGDTLPLEQD